MTALGKLAVVCFTHVGAQDDPVEVLGRWVDLIHEVLQAPTGFEALGLVMRYLDGRKFDWRGTNMVLSME